MPSLKVPCVAATNSASSTCRKRLNFCIGGIVASPTPTVAMASLSTSLISVSRDSAVDSIAAAIQPADPPPTITIRRTASARGSAGNSSSCAKAVMRAVMGKGGARRNPVHCHRAPCMPVSPA